MKLPLFCALAALLFSACGPQRSPVAADTQVSAMSPIDSLLGNSQWVVERLGAESGTTLQGLTLDVAGTDRISGHDGCNQFTVSVLIKDPDFKIGEPMAGTKMACPDAVMNRAGIYRSTLQSVVKFRMVGTQLELQDSTGKTVLALVRASTSLANTQWKALSYNNGKQAVVSVLAGTKITAQFGEDGRITGDAGCNSYFAAYKISGDGLAIESPGSTRKFCSEPEGVTEQESQYLSVLASVTQYRRTGDRLELRDKEGALVAIFKRSGNITQKKEIEEKK